MSYFHYFVQHFGTCLLLILQLYWFVSLIRTQSTVAFKIPELKSILLVLLKNNYTQWKRHTHSIFLSSPLNCITNQTSKRNKCRKTNILNRNSLKHHIFMSASEKTLLRKKIEKSVAPCGTKDVCWMLHLSSLTRRPSSSIPARRKKSIVVMDADAGWRGGYSA